MVAQLGISLIDQGLPTLTGFVKSDLAVSAATAGLAVSSFSFGKVVGAYGAGVLADRIGERRVIVSGSLVVAVLVAAVGAAPITLVFVLLVLAGVAGSASTPAGGRLVLIRFPPERRGLALSIRQTAIPLGGLLAAATLPTLAAATSWRISLAFAAGLCALSALPLLALAQPAESVRRPASAGAAAFRERNVVLLTIWGCFVVTGQYATLAFFALDLHQNAGISLARGSLLVAAANACGIVGRIAWGAWSDRALSRGRKPLLLLLNLAGISAALLMLVIPRAHGDVLRFLPVAAILGFALIGYQGLFVTMVAEAAGPHRVGAAMGFTVTFVQLAITLTPPLFGLAADLAGTYRAVWAVLLVLLGIALVPAFLISETAVNAPERDSAIRA